MSEERPLVELIGIGKRYGSGETAFDALHDINPETNTKGYWQKFLK